MGGPLAGIRVIDVSQFGFVPAAASVLADWGADVIHVEHPEQGDPMRGMTVAGFGPATGPVNLMYELAGRGKRALGLDLAQPEGRDLLLRLVDTADVFVTSLLPRARSKLGIDVDDVMGRNARIVYARGCGQGVRGPDADRGGFDMISFWYRSGVATAITPPDAPYPLKMPAPGFGDLLSGLILAGGIGTALAQRERTGRGTVVDVSLLATGMWVLQPNIVGSALVEGDNIDWPSGREAPANPLANAYRTRDDRVIALNMLQSDRYWRGFCEAVERSDLAGDQRFTDGPARARNARELVSILDDVFATRDLAEWSERLSEQDGQWDVVRAPGEVLRDPQVAANGYTQTVTASSGRPMQVVMAPVQFDERPNTTAPAPALGADTDRILLELGVDWDRLVELKSKGVVT